jgi:hypothetical protein
MFDSKIDLGMKNKLTVLVLVCFLVLGGQRHLLGQAPQLEWAKQFGLNGGDIGFKVRLDAARNIYVMGSFTQTVDFDPGPGIHELSTGFTASYFFLKLDFNGNFVWVRNIINPYPGLREFDMDVSPSGELWTAGTFNNTLDYEPGVQGHVFNNGALLAGFVLKLKVDGSIDWVSRVDASNGCHTYDIDVDRQGNAYICGGFTGTMDLDPGPGVLFSPSNGGSDAFVCKVNPAGNLIWGKSFGAGGADYARCLGVDNSGNVSYTGEFQYNVDFDPSPTASFPLNTGAATTGFMAQLNGQGAFNWAKMMSPITAYEPEEITIDSLGYIYAVGHFDGQNIDFDMGPTTDLHSSVGYDAFVYKMSSTGGHEWARTYGGISQDLACGIGVNWAGDVMISGYSNSASLDLNPGAGVFTVNSAGNNDMHLLRLDASGNFLWASQQGAAYADAALGIIFDRVGNLYVTGGFSGTVDLDPGTAVQNFTSFSSFSFDGDCFLSKLSWCPSTSHTLTLSACDSIVANGQTYHTSGSYAQLYSNSVGCDSILLLNLSISQPTAGALTQAACDSLTINGTTYYSSGTYVQSLQNVAGCDSTLTLVLSITTINPAVTLSGFTITAVQTGATYMWLNCDNGYAPLIGDVFRDYTPTTNGHYAVRITLNGCRDTSACVEVLPVGIEHPLGAQIAVSPNPSLGEYVVDLSALAGQDCGLAVFDGLGHRVWEASHARGAIHMDLRDLPAGIYFLRVMYDGRVETRALLKAGAQN